MIITIEPSRACGIIKAPPSKSFAHRALIAGALSKECKVYNIEYSSDIEATLDCLCALGARVERGEDFVTLGELNPFKINSCTLNCRDSGSTLRFLMPLCMLSGNDITLVGTKRLLSRNLDVYSEIARDNNIEFIKGEDFVKVCGKLKASSYKIRGDISSQFITGLLFALPLTNGDKALEIIGDFESEPYVNITLRVLELAGVKIEKTADKHFEIKGNQGYNLNEITVEGDYSNAAFLDAFNLLDGDVMVEGLNKDSLQGDKIYLDFYKALKAGKREFDLANCPDLAPVMFAMSSLFSGGHFVGTKRLKIKESDRAKAMKAELLKFGIEVTVGDNEVEVKSGKLKPPYEILFGHNDHRIIMALSLLLTLTGGSISGADAVKKSYPDFFSKIKTLGIVIKNGT